LEQYTEGLSSAGRLEEASNVGPNVDTGMGSRSVDNEADYASSAAELSASGTSSVRIALIDAYRFSLECLMRAFEWTRPSCVIRPFSGLRDCLSTSNLDIDVILYNAHEDGGDGAILNTVTSIRHTLERTPLIILSDAYEAQEPKTIRRVLRSGVRGFIPTRSTSFPTMFAAINFVRAGGVFAPVDLLLANRPELPAPPQANRAERLTPRQLAVLSHLQQGKANKLIAYELRMSESTVKCHVRAIMRKLGATNRTQAVYKAQALCHSVDF